MLSAMPTITRIAEQRRRANRRNIFLDGKFAMGVNLNVVAKFRLREGMTLSTEQVRELEQGEVRQECFDKAIEYLSRRLHSRRELKQKLLRREYGEGVVESVLDDLQRLGYVDDARFAQTKALAAAQHKGHGRRRAMMELIKSGIRGPTLEKALQDVYAERDDVAMARQIALKQAARLRRLDPMVARRRLAGGLQRRGFDYETIRPVIEETLGPASRQGE